MKAIIMAGGEGSRLRPLTVGMPKPLTKLCNRPTVEYILDLLANHNCSEAVFTLRYKGEMIEKHFEEHNYKGIKLSFAYENEPLGTAGCVKNAAGDFKGNLLVISGDALCDFDLESALKFHIEKNADATIITKRINDPREYGLVIEQEGCITGFSEKPSYLNCISDYANTGIYIITEKVLEMIPESKMWDFANDVFPEMIERHMPLYTYKGQGYWCDIGDLRTYRESQFDMLLGKLRWESKGEKIQPNFYSESPIPDNATIIPPCYIGKNVNIGEHALLERVVICDNVTIGKNAHIYGSIIMDGVYFGGNTVSECAIVCENAKIDEFTVLCEECVVGENTVIGEKSEVKPGVKIWRDKNINAFSVINTDIKHTEIQKIEIGENGINGVTNIDIDMETAVKIGGSAAALSPAGILMSSENNHASKSLKRAIESGISASGVNITDCGFVTLPVLIYLSKILDCGLIVYVDAKRKADVIILNKYGLNLTRSQERILEGGLRRREYKTVGWKDFGDVRTINNCESFYINSLIPLTEKISGYKIFPSCKNEKILEYSAQLFERISDKSGKNLIINISEQGDFAEFHLNYDENSLLISHEKLILISCIHFFKKGRDVALPASFPVAADVLSKKYNCKVHRYFACSNDNSDINARNLSKNQPFLRDGVYLALFVLDILIREKLTLEEILREVPDFSREQRIIKINCPPQRILSDFCEKDLGMGEGIMLNQSMGKILLRSNKSGDSLFLYAESLTAETAAELCDDIEKRINLYNDHKNR